MGQPSVPTATQRFPARRSAQRSGRVFQGASSQVSRRCKGRTNLGSVTSGHHSLEAQAIVNTMIVPARRDIGVSGKMETSMRI